jgi:hypothetical protein
MNTNFVEIIKRIIAEQGEDILADAQRVKGLVQDYAAKESKLERLAFGRCIEYGAYTELKNAESAQVRQAVKAAVAQKVHSNEGMDIALCNDALDVLEAAMFGGKNLCQSCGKELQDGWKACPYCLTTVAMPEPVLQSQPSVTSAPQAAAPQYQQAQYQQPIQAQAPQSQESNDWGAMVIAIVVVIVFVIAIIVFNS